MTETSTTIQQFMAEHEGHHVKYAEDCPTYRTVVGMDAATGTLRIDGFTDMADEGDNPRLFCVDCLADCPVDGSAEIHWL